MHAQPFGQPPPGTQYFIDPQASTQVYPQQPLAPPPDRPSLRRLYAWLAIVAVIAFVAAAVEITGFKITPSGTSTQAGRLQSQVTTLQHKVSSLSTENSALSGQLATLHKQYATLSSTVGGMTRTVHNLAPYANAVCPGVFQGSKGAFNAPVPCNPGG